MLAALLPPDVVTTTLAVPAVPAGVTAVMVVELTTVKPVAAVPPMVTAVAPVKLVPVMVTLVPPAAGPLDGLMLETVGGSGTAVPVRLMVCVEALTLRLLSVSTVVPAVVPLAGVTGANSRLMLQLVPDASEKVDVQSAGVPEPATCV